MASSNNKSRFEEHIKERQKQVSKNTKDDEKTSSSKTQSSSNTKSSNNAQTRFEERMKERQSGVTNNTTITSDSISTFLLDAEDYLSNSKSRHNNLGYSNASDAWNKNRKESNNLLARAYSIKDYLQKNKSSITEKSYNSLMKQISVIDDAVRGYTGAFRDARKFYAQWETEEDYLKWKKDTEEYEALKNFDTKKGEAEVQDLEKVLNEYKALSRTMIDDRMQARLDYLTEQYGGEKGIKTLISEKKQYMNRAKHIQEGITLAGVIENDDFKDNSGYVSTKNDGKWSKLTSDFGMGYDDLTYEYINGEESGMRQEIINKAVSYDADTEKFFVYDHMTDDQIATYNYYYAKKGKDAAEKYLDSIQETLNYQAATERYEKMEGKTALELLFGIEAGVDQFQSGMKNLFNTEDDYIAQSSTQMVSGMVREDLADNGAKLPDWLGGASLAQAGYDAITTTANMAPSIMTSTVLNIIAPGSGAAVGSAMMGASAAGNAYQEMLNLGYDKNQARTYSTLVGASEAGLQYLLGGIGELGGKLSGNALTKMLNGIDNAFLRTALQIGGNMLSEGAEEGLQEILTPWFQNLIMHTDEDINWSEVAYSTLLGALTAGVMEGPTTIGDAVSIRNTGKQLQAADISAKRLAEIGKTFSADTVAYQLAGKVDENTGAYTMGRLFNEIGATLSEQNVTEVTEALVAKGMDQTTAKKNAQALAYVVEGGQLTDKQIAMIEANEVLADVARATLVDANTTWNQRTNALKALSEEMTAPKTAQAKTVQQSQENAPITDTVDTQNKEGAQSLSEAVDTSPAKVQTISSIENGQVTVKLEDGTEINVKEADLSVDDGVRIETIAKLEGISATDANFILNTLRTNTSASAQMDSLGAREAYKYGFYGFSDAHMTTHGVFSNSLTESQRKAIYETGRAARQRQVEAKQATVAKNATTSNKDSNKVSGKVHFEGDRSTLTERQSASLTAMEKVADALGVQIYVFESQVNERGKRVGANGWYDPKDGSIHIDLHAGANGEGTMLFTAAHELTHFIRQWSPAKFKTLADFLMQEYGKKGVNVDALVREQMNKAKRNGRTISYDTAYEEVVADSMEMMLADGKVMEKLAKLKAQDKSLWQKIKDFINELAAKIRSVYEGMAPDSVEGRHVAEMVDAIERLQDLFTEGLVEASENYQSSLTPGEEGVVVNENGDPVAYSTEDGSVLLSMRTYDEEGRKAFRDYLNKCVSSNKLTKAEMHEMMDGIEDIYQTCKEFKDKYAPFSSWSDAAVVRDTYGKPVFSVVTPNGDYKMNLDFSLVCKKRRTLDAVFNEMSRRGIIDDFELGQKSVVKINEIIRRHGLETACALCFVDAKRFRQASMADQFTSLYNELVLSLVPEEQRSRIDHFNFSGYETIKKVEDGIHKWDASKLDFSHLDEVMKNYGKGTVEHKAAKYIKSHAEGRRLLLRGDFMSSQGFDAVKTQNKDILKLYNSKKGTGGPKAAFGDVQYMNEIIKKARTWTPAKAYAVGGVRIQSFSDYVPRMVFDYVQMIYDLAATNLPAHAYTKEALFVKQFGLTGVKINMSLIPAIAEGGIAPGLDANGNYVWAGESFDFETAKEIQNAEGYTENCGTICVGVSDRHIRKLLSDPDIRMVIPYHKSGLNPIVAHMNKIAEFTDYTNKQNTTVKGTGAKAEKHFDFNKALHDMGENADPKAVIQQYFDWCDDNGYDPKFADFRDHPNYYKLIEDFTLYDKDGKYVPQREVRAVFPKEGSAFGSMKDLIKAGLEEDAIIEGKKESSLSSIVDEIQKTLPRTEAEIAEEQVEQADKDLEADVKLSDRDYSYDALVSKPDMVVTEVGGNVPKNRADIFAMAKKNATSVGRFDPKTGSISVLVKDIGTDVVLGTTGLKHGLEGRRTDNAIVTLKAGEILQNSIRINELTPKKENAEGSYVLIGAARGGNGDLYIVRSVVNTFKHELMSMDVLYAINAKKGNRLRSMRPGFQGPVTDSTISIAELLDHVNQYFPDILPEEVLKHYGYDARPEGKLGEDALYSDRDYQNVVSKAVETFGTTTDFAEAGFILPNGKMLKFTDDNHSGERQYDHRAIGIAYGVDVDLSVNHGFNYESNNHLNDFVENGGIRFDPGSMEFGMDAGMQLSKSIPITKEQEMAIRDFVEWKKQREEMYNSDDDPLSLYDGPLTLHIDFGGGAGFAISSSAKDLDAWGVKHLTYEGGQINASRIIADIRHYYRTGETRQQSSVAQFRYSDRDSESVSNRSLLANAFEGVAQNEMEKQKIQEYKGKISLIESEERKLSELNQQIKDLSFSKGPKDTKAIRDLQFEAKQTANRISTYDKQLLRLEASKPLQDVLTREKNLAYKRAEKKGKEALEAYREKTMKTQRELIEKWQESRKKGVENREKTAMRHKVQNVVGELNNLLLTDDKKRHVPDNLKKAVAEALDLVNMDTVGAEERAAKYAALIAKETDPDKIDAYTATMENILRQGEKMGKRLKELHEAYEEIQNSDDPDIANAYDPVIAGAIKELSQTIGKTSLRNMTLDQLSDVYDVYRMVLTRVRDANKTLLDNIKESISNLASRTIGEVRMAGGEHKTRATILDPVKKFMWNNMKPVYAMEYIGSSTLTKVFNNVRSGEDVWAKDVTEAREYYLDKAKKYGYNSWDFKKKYRFQSASDLEFELTLEQILSLYAYSKREQAHDHLRLGGFVFDSNIETYKDKGSKLIKYKVNTADAHQISPEILANIIGTLTSDQMGFVDEMQEYLSAVMGAKGNEVTSKMYGVKLFKEKFYFPLKSAKQFMFEQNEVSGEVKIKNSGFTNKVVAKANNPVILSNFMEVWSGHVNDMSMYHAFTLPLEDFNRVFNYNSPKKENQPSVSVKGTIQNAYSPAAVHYVKQLITDLNGGARSDSTTGFINKMMGLFKKGSVFASLSVVIQQPSAIARAAALVDTKYFIGPKVDHKRHKALWAEVKQYAPVAIIKEMGYFDTNMGKSTQDFILSKEYSGFTEKMKALFADSGYRDEALSKAPALADELAWCSIWEAVKRETKAKYPGLDTKAEPFLKLCGSRFTEVIVKTQVYDSVLSRSGLMRSKDTGMKMATAFMAEPTTSINMITDALLKGKRGNRKYARGAIGAVIASQILNSILVSFVYAGRDDDEDETYVEKYIGTLTGQTLDSLNPAGYLPFIKDIMSIVQGYDVERSDMAVISDLWKAIENLKKDTVSPYRKVEGFAGSIAQIFGLPVKNIMRDVRGIYQTIDSFVNGQKTTKAGIGYAVKGAITGKDVSNDQQLYEAILNGDQTHIARVKGRFKDQTAINNAIRKALKENDPRIHDAAVAWNANDLDEYMRIAREIIGEKYFSQDDVVMAIRSEANKLAPSDGSSGTSKAKGLFTAEKFAEAIAQGDQATANAIKTDIIQTAQKNGKTAADAEKSFASTAKGDLKEMFLAGEINESRAIQALTNFCGESKGEAEQIVSEWSFENKHGFKYDDKRQKFMEGEISASELKDLFITVEGKTEDEANTNIVRYARDAYEEGLFDRDNAASVMIDYGGLTDTEAENKLRYIDVKREFPDTFVDDAWVEEYYKEIESSGISIEAFVDYRNQVKEITGEGKKERRMAVINSMPISKAQKDALYYAEGWATSRLYEAPWR